MGERVPALLSFFLALVRILLFFKKDCFRERIPIECLRTFFFEHHGAQKKKNRKVFAHASEIFEHHQFYFF